MKGKVFVRLKEGVLDPQGKAVEQALSHLGFSGVSDVRIGKLIELELKTSSKDKAEKELNAMCKKLLANTVIESYSVELDS
jgi:phosphoribosylformylglycinamidine synthase subunit PurS